MKKIEMQSVFTWKENLVEILGIEQKPFLLVKPTQYQEPKYYMYGGIEKNKLKLFFYPYKMPEPRIDYCLIDPQDICNRKTMIYKKSESQCADIYLSTDLFDISYEKEFSVGRPYKIIDSSKNIHYGFYTHNETYGTDTIYFFDCYFSLRRYGQKIESMGFPTHEHQFYELDDMADLALSEEKVKYIKINSVGTGII